MCQEEKKKMTIIHFSQFNKKLTLGVEKVIKILNKEIKFKVQTP